MSGCILRLIVSRALLFALLTQGCRENGGDAKDEAAPSRIEAQLSEARSGALEFWWQQGQGTRAEHLVLASAGDGALRLAVFELPLRSPGWRSLFDTTPDGVAFSSFELALARDVNASARATVAERIDTELGGRGAFELPVEAGLQVGGESLDAVVLGSALLAVPSALADSERAALFDELTLAHAAARRREADSGDAAAYASTYAEVLATVGWLSVSSEKGELAAGQSLLARMAPLATAEPGLRALGLVE
jgi:hypothetical protein